MTTTSNAVGSMASLADSLTGNIRNGGRGYTLASVDTLVLGPTGAEHYLGSAGGGGGGGGTFGGFNIRPSPYDTFDHTMPVAKSNDTTSSSVAVEKPYDGYVEDVISRIGSLDGKGKSDDYDSAISDVLDILEKDKDLYAAMAPADDSTRAYDRVHLLVTKLRKGLITYEMFVQAISQMVSRTGPLSSYAIEKGPADRLGTYAVTVEYQESESRVRIRCEFSANTVMG